MMNRKVQQDPTGLPRMLIEKTGRQLDLEDPLTAIVYMILLFFFQIFTTDATHSYFDILGKI